MSSPSRIVTAIAAPVLGGVLGAFVHGLVGATGVTFPLAYAVGLGVASGALLVTLLTLVRSVDVPLPQRAPRAQVTIPDNPLLAVTERRLAGAARERRSYVAGLQPVLLEVARDRLRLHASLDLDQVLPDPERARALLGADLAYWLTTTDRVGVPPSPTQLAALVAALEDL